MALLSMNEIAQSAGHARNDLAFIAKERVTIRVRGVVIRKEKGPYIEVDDPSEIEMASILPDTPK